jgi:hypothetical protein
MATFEQLVFGYRPDQERGREILGSSPGISRECADEIVRLCEGWGAVPAEGLRRPVLMSFPLITRLSALAGDLHVVIRVASGLRPVFHALVLTRRDYETFDLNPYTLAQEDPFLDRWDRGLDLPRRQLEPGAIAPLVSPPPDAGDVGFVDEAVRQMLANQALLLPLERSSHDSDRFLALVIAALPRVLRLDLRFAAWAPSGGNRFSLAATYRDNALYTSWQPYLMTSVLGELEASCEEYVEHVRTCLRNGDLAGLENHSRHASVDLSRTVVGGKRTRPKTLTASVDERSARQQKARQTRHETKRAATDAATARRKPLGATATAAPGAPPARRAGGTRPRPRRRPPSGAARVRRVFAILLLASVLGASGYYFWTSGHWTRLPGLGGAKLQLKTDSQHGVVDVGALYAGLLAGAASGDMGAATVPDDRARERGLAMLDQAGQLLCAQSEDFLDETDQTLAGEIRGTHEPAPAAPLRERGRVLARELRRLALARVSLGRQLDWRDLADLDARALEVRLDSLLTGRHDDTSVEPEVTRIDALLHSVAVRTRQVDGMATLEQLLAADRWQPGWVGQCAEAVDDLGGVRHPRARRLRDDAALLARVKRAERASDLGGRAYREDYAPRGWSTPALLDVLPDLHRRAKSAPSELPDLLQATERFYATVSAVTAEPTPAAEHGQAVTGLAANAAVRFDPELYGDHVERLRFLLLERLAAEGTPADSLPPICFAGGPPQEHLDVLAALQSGADAEAWRELAGRLETPFLRRWAQDRVVAREAAARDRRQAFEVALGELARQRSLLLRLAGGGGRCGAAWRELAAAAEDLHAQHAPGFPDVPATHAAWQRLGALAAALASPPELQAAAVTVRLDQERTDGSRRVVVELLAGQGAPQRSAPITLGPSAPAGSGWVGTTDLAWSIGLAAAEPLQLRVLDANDGTPLATLACDGWLVDWDAADLAALDSGQGVRVSLRPARPYWSALALPELL